MNTGDLSLLVFQSCLSSYFSFVNLRWSYKCWPHAMDYRIFSRLQRVQKVQRIFHKAWTKHWSQYLGKWPRGMKTHQTELYDMYQAQGCPKVIHRKKHMQRCAAWTFWPWHWDKLRGVRHLPKQIRGMEFVTGFQQTLWTWHQNICHRTSIFLQPEWTWYRVLHKKQPSDRTVDSSVGSPVPPNFKVVCFGLSPSAFRKNSHSS